MCAVGHHSGDGHNHDSTEYSAQMPRTIQRNADYSQTDSIADYLAVKYK